jgi:hypothetical protein
VIASSTTSADRVAWRGFSVYRALGIGFFKKAVRNRSTLKLVLPARMRFLAGKYATRCVRNGNLVIAVSNCFGEVKICRVSRKVHAVVMNVGRYSRFFRPGPAYFEYDRGVLVVWQKRGFATQ